MSACRLPFRRLALQLVLSSASALCVAETAPPQDAAAQRTATTATRQCGALYANQYLALGDSMPSCNGRATLVHQNDGNVVEYVSTGALWDTGTWGRSTSHFIMQTDGNLVLYNGPQPIWASNTAGNPGAWLAVQDDCNLVIYSGGGGVLWATNRFCP
ncbi:hypothetical protein OOT46_10340 [Aquabacterium sp. A7-Y]|uniref:hypothetical protein n=1 Tax=Aquabacterium sp. A7-Y TaxID=1349605 RepID=UPI00223CDEA5|nr:hypothetical protein [Aquabacterium sp. A7-Y]MCW7538245.1 hypothetical protein [Aquabacterium sp. A7-Y]